jgi:DNA-binding MarR family transcriptional regulator
MKIEDELQSSFRNEHHKLMVNLILTTARLNNRFEQILKGHAISGTQYNVLRILRGQKQKAVSIGLVKERMIDKNSDVSRIIDRLLAKKLIERTENADDRRQKDVYITAKGLALLKKIDACDAQIDAELQYLSAAEAKQLNQKLDKLRSGLKNTGSC